MKWREEKEGGEGKGARAEDKEKEVKERGLSQKCPIGQRSILKGIWIHKQLIDLH